MSGNRFWQIIKSGKRWEAVMLTNCTILTDEGWEFGELKNWNIKTLGLTGSGSENTSNWAKIPDRFTNIINGISNWYELNICLNEIHLSSCEIEMNIAQDTLDVFGMKHIKIIN